MSESFENKWKNEDPEDLTDRLEEIEIEDSMEKASDEFTDIEDDDLPEL